MAQHCGFGLTGGAAGEQHDGGVLAGHGPVRVWRLDAAHEVQQSVAFDDVNPGVAGQAVGVVGVYDDYRRRDPRSQCRQLLVGQPVVERDKGQAGPGCPEQRDGQSNRRQIRHGHVRVVAAPEPLGGRPGLVEEAPVGETTVS